MKLIDNIKKKFSKEQAPGDDFLAAVDKSHKTTEKRLSAKEKRQRQIEDCGAVLRDCRATFEKSIIVENALAGDMRLKGYDTTKQRSRVREAAIGILVVDQALFELQSINSESELNSAMNKMGMALKQMRRVNNNTAAVSKSTQKLIEQWYPGALSEDIEDEDAVLPGMEVPEEMRSKIDEHFVENLMLGDSYEIAMFKHNLTPPPTAAAGRSSTSEILDGVRAAVHQDPSADEDHSAVVNQHSGKF